MVEDFDIAVKLKEIMNVIESKNEIINIKIGSDRPETCEKGQSLTTL